MAQSLSKVNLHIVFSTKNRAKLILPECQEKLHAYLASACRALDSYVYRVGGTHDHIHVGCTLPRTISLSKFLEQIKSSSSKWMKTEFQLCRAFSWQRGYAAFSFGSSQVDKVVSYIQYQEKHHQAISFQDELRDLLGKYNVDFDERYVWE